MKKKIVALVMAGIMSMAVLAGCGGDEPAAAETKTEASSASKTETKEEKSESKSEDKPAASSKKKASTPQSAGAPADAQAVFVDGYYANDGSSDLMLAFYEVGSVDIAYVTDGEYEFWSQYTVEQATTDDGTDYLLVTFTDAETAIGYIDNGDGDYYLVDENGTVYAAAQLTEEEAEYIYAAVQEGASDEGAATEAETAWQYDAGYYVNDGTSDAVICFFMSSDGDQVAYLNDGSDELFAEYTVSEEELDDGTPFMLVTIGNVQLGYFTDGTDWYIVDEDGTISAAAELTEEEANVILEAVAQ